MWSTVAVAQGVPTVDAGLAIRNQAANAQRESDLAVQRETLTVEEELTEIEREQLRVLQQILDTQSSFGGQGIPEMVASLETGSTPEQSADLLYGEADPNPASDQMFGDAALNIEQLIIQVAQETHSLGGVGEAGLSVRQWRALLQALIWQESRFTIGARSHVGAFGLTQIMPGTAGDLGIYPEYYDSPYLQVEGGARYLAAQLARFDGNIIYALAAYNAGPGRVIEYSGVPPFQETQHYVTVIPQKYNAYLASMGGVEALGTIDPALLANSNLSLASAGAATYGNHSMASIQAAAQRVANIVQRIGETQDLQESMALNAYARAELVRLIAARTRLQATRTRPLSAEELAMAASQLNEQQFMDFTLEELE
ncbi:lytic transglycosylase domain-containing protein [Loktanella sp. Alg231-35]|uniref:lytic transglycosylase domain-containing protein n=1 Tax=Loktanella sp. Alg231-35 TaxID=1922220 RepID=UPI002795AB75|nr:lytic transglycosylase domain-containing protein [Loktanella sp. Alg231-35]